MKKILVAFFILPLSILFSSSNDGTGMMEVDIGRNYPTGIFDKYAEDGTYLRLSYSKSSMFCLAPNIVGFLMINLLSVANTVLGLRLAPPGFILDLAQHTNGLKTHTRMLVTNQGVQHLHLPGIGNAFTPMA